MKNVLRRSIRSMLYSAMMPPMTAARPKRVLASVAAVSLKPDSFSTREP